MRGLRAHRFGIGFPREYWLSSLQRNKNFCRLERQHVQQPLKQKMQQPEGMQFERAFAGVKQPKLTHIRNSVFEKKYLIYRQVRVLFLFYFDFFKLNHTSQNAHLPCHLSWNMDKTRSSNTQLSAAINQTGQ